MLPMPSDVMLTWLIEQAVAMTCVRAAMNLLFHTILSFVLLGNFACVELY
jgi:hypothetical protein